MNYKSFLLIILFVPLINSCGNKNFEKNPVDNLIRDMNDVPIYSIILNDMEEAGTFFKEYRHQYRIIKQDTKDSEPAETLTDWYAVGEDFFNQNINNMGMEVAAKTEDGKITKTAAPPGYNNYVGNPKYGQWQGSGGNSFWAFYGQYAFMSSMFNLLTYPARRSYYDDYRGSYYGTGRPYYGPAVNGRRAYGTNSTYTTQTKPNTRWSRSTSSRSFRSGSSQPTSRSGSRFGSSSSRSRGGGFGK